MSTTHKTFQTDEVDIVEVITWLWKEKIVILSISLIFFVSAFIHTSLKPKQFKTIIVLKEIPLNLFLKFDNVIDLKQQQQQQQQQQNTFALLFDNKFHEQLGSFSNLDKFYNQNKKISSFKSTLMEKNISAKDYFYVSEYNSKFGNLKDRRKKIIKNKYYLNFPKELKGDQFLNDYIMFTFQDSLQYTKDKILLYITEKKNYLSQLLNISKKLNLEKSILNENLKTQKLLKNEIVDILSNRPEVIQFQVNNLEKLIIEANNLNLKFDPILDKASRPVRINAQSPLKYGILFSMVGFIFSLIYLAIRKIIKNTDKS